MTITDDNYRAFPAYSNSDLGELLGLVSGKTAKPINPKTAQFGTTFHTLLLETQKPIDWSIHHVTEHNHILKMRDSFSGFWLKEYPDYPIVEQQTEAIKTRICSGTGLPLKSKLDMIAKHSRFPDPTDNHTFVVDLKTTSAGSVQEFFDTFVEYGYDRQAAFYLDMVGFGYNFLFVGIQKKAPYAIYAVDMSATSDRRAIIDRGRTKNTRLLRHALEESQKPSGWRPSAWSRKGETV